MLVNDYFMQNRLNRTGNVQYLREGLSSALSHTHTKMSQ